MLYNKKHAYTNKTMKEKSKSFDSPQLHFHDMHIFYQFLNAAPKGQLNYSIYSIPITQNKRNNTK